MSWVGLALSCLVVSVIANSLVRRFWVALCMSALGGPLLFLLMSGPEAFAALVLVMGQIIALPVAVLVGASFRALRV